MMLRKLIDILLDLIGGRHPQPIPIRVGDGRQDSQTHFAPRN